MSSRTSRLPQIPHDHCGHFISWTDTSTQAQSSALIPNTSRMPAKTRTPNVPGALPPSQATDPTTEEVPPPPSPSPSQTRCHSHSASFSSSIPWSTFIAQHATMFQPPTAAEPPTTVPEVPLPANINPSHSPTLPSPSSQPKNEPPFPPLILDSPLQSQAAITDDTDSEPSSPIKKEAPEHSSTHFSSLPTVAHQFSSTPMHQKSPPLIHLLIYPYFQILLNSHTHM